jgi:hypothetical protein
VAGLLSVGEWLACCRLTIDARPLDLDGDGTAVPQRRAVNLSERSSDDRLRTELDERRATTLQISRKLFGLALPEAR